MVRPFLYAIALVCLFSIIILPPCLALDNTTIKIKILSGDGNLESAQKSADHLKNLGYNVARIDHASRSDFTSSVIYFAKTHKAVAQNLASELNVLEKNIRPLTWRSAFDIIIVSVDNPLSSPEPEKPLKTKKVSPKKDQKPTVDQIQTLEENISFAIAEAHALFVNKEYKMANEKYKSLAAILTQAQKLCTSRKPKRKIENNKILVQVLSQNTDTDKANKIVQRLAKDGYSVSDAEHTLRSDLVENAIYYAPAVKEQAQAIAANLDESFALLPLQWSSEFQIIIVSSTPAMEDIQVIDIDKKFSELHQKEQQIKETIDLMIYEAFDLLSSGGNCEETRNKFEGVKTHLKLVESVCETAIRLGAPTSGAGAGSPESPKTTTIVNLKEAIAIALLHNTSIKEVEEKVNAAVEEKKSAYADFLPRASFNYSYTRLNEAPSMNFDLPSDFPVQIDGDWHMLSLPFLDSIGGIPMGSKDNFSWNLTLSQPVFTGFGLLSQYELKKINLEITEIQKKTAILNLVRNVKQAYYDLLLAQKLELVTQETVKNLRSHKDDAEQFYNQGMIPYNDLLKTQVSLANAVQENEKAKSLTKIAASALNLLLDYDINQTIEVQEIYSLSPNNFQLTDLMHEAVENRPELELINLAVKSSDLAIRAVKSAYYPQVSVIGRYEQTGQDLLATENDYAEVESSSVTLQASWALFKGGKTKYDIAKLSFDKKALEKQYEGAENSIQLEVKNIYENLLVSEKNIKTSQESVAQAKENWRITNLQYQEQIATSTDVLDARTFLSQAQLNYLRAHYGYMKSLADLERALGKTTAYATTLPSTPPVALN